MPKALHEVVNTILARSVPQGDCLLFTGSRARGYGMVTAKAISPYPQYTHRLVFLHRHGHLPEKPYEISHLCDTPSCVNIDHIIEETHQMNMDRVPPERRGRPRGATCGKGHPFTPENTMPVLRNGRPTRRCRTCHRLYKSPATLPYYAVKEGT